MKGLTLGFLLPTYHATNNQSELPSDSQLLDSSQTA